MVDAVCGPSNRGQCNDAEGGRKNQKTKCPSVLSYFYTLTKSDFMCLQRAVEMKSRPNAGGS